MPKTVTKIRSADTPTLMRIAAAGREQGYDRQLSEEFMETVDFFGTHMIVNAAALEYADDVETMPLMRVQMFVKTLYGAEPVMVEFDLSVNDYDALSNQTVAYEEDPKRNV